MISTTGIIRFDQIKCQGFPCESPCLHGVTWNYSFSLQGLSATIRNVKMQEVSISLLLLRVSSKFSGSSSLPSSILFSHQRWETIVNPRHTPWNVFTVQCSAVQCSAVQCSAVQCSAVQYSAAKYSTVKYSTVQYTCYFFSSLHYFFNFWDFF